MTFHYETLSYCFSYFTQKLNQLQGDQVFHLQETTPTHDKVFQTEPATRLVSLLPDKDNWVFNKHLPQLSSKMTGQLVMIMVVVEMASLTNKMVVLIQRFMVVNPQDLQFVQLLLVADQSLADQSQVSGKLNIWIKMTVLYKLIFMFWSDINKLYYIWNPRLYSQSKAYTYR